MSSSRDGFTTATEHAYEVISRAILTSKLEPGQRLPRRAMADLTGVSTVAVIEALHRLEAEGLVESRPHLGARVVSLDADLIRDRCELREAIETHVARILASQITEEQAADMLRFAETIDGYAADEATLGLFWEHHHAFHLRLAELTGCESLVDALRKIGFFLLLQRLHITLHRVRQKREDHVTLVRAIMSRDPAEAESRMRHHVTSLTQALADEQPGPESRPTWIRAADILHRGR
jgi:DNA-binding GntR family transcriptional regulator